MLAFDTTFYFRRTIVEIEKNYPEDIYTKKKNKENSNYMNKRLLGEIQKMDENNQYCNTMTKPLPA